MDVSFPFLIIQSGMGILVPGSEIEAVPSLVEKSFMEVSNDMNHLLKFLSCFHFQSLVKNVLPHFKLK